jgi:hypothetical protein
MRRHGFDVSGGGCFQPTWRVKSYVHESQNQVLTFFEILKTKQHLPTEWAVVGKF